MTLLDRLSSLRLVVVTGKGGTGKSAVACTLGRILAGGGRRVLVLEIDPRESLHQFLGVSPSDGEVVRASPALYFQNLDPRRVVDEMVKEQLAIGPLVRRVLASPVYRQFAEGAPGLKELAVLLHATRILEHVKDADRRSIQPPETVVLDAPATGHAVGLLAAPLRIAEVIRSGPIARKTEELAALVRDAERCGILVVSLAEEMPVQESLELIESLDARIERRPDAVVLNELWPRSPGPAEGPPSLAAARRAVNDRETGRLAAGWRGPVVELPFVPVHRGPGLLDALRPALESALAGAEEAS